jgi:hypothetical protein
VSAWHSELLDKAVDPSPSSFSRKNAGNLLLSRGGKLLGSQNAISATPDFDLITWLVIKNAQ